ncbi:hypothetical protein BJX70DRAFT_407520 [Aspergillus crustosus]
MEKDTLEDASPAAEERQIVYEKGFRIWQSLYECAMQGSGSGSGFGFPKSCFQFQPALLHQPHFPQNLDLKVTYNCLFASGISVWKDTQHVSADADLDLRHARWFNTEENHLSVLVFAWSYILSARWTQLMPEAILAYTESKAYSSDEARERDLALVDVDIGVVDDDAARWWTAILAPGQGWEAYITIKQEPFHSPWSITLPPTPNFCLPAAALHYLSNYCALHGIVKQGYAALSAVLFLPLLHGSRKHIILPRPKFGNDQERRVEASSKRNVQLHLACVQEDHHLDKLLTLSCHTRGLRSLLSSVFYEPGITCNVVSPWLQSIFAVINSVEDDRDRILTKMLMNRIPHLAFFWLGAALLDIQREVLQEGEHGLIPTEMHAAAWTRTMQSFMQENPTIGRAGDDYILRPDECRLLYLTQGQYHTSWPICPWAPFGATAIKDTEIDVRLHADCIGHSLQYASWEWICRDGTAVEHQVLEPEPAHAQALLPQKQEVMASITVNFGALNHGEESASENATRSIFSWLRVEGYPSNEKKVHEWVKIDESDNESDGESLTGKDSGKSHAALRAEIEDWIDRNVNITDDCSV